MTSPEHRPETEGEEDIAQFISVINTLSQGDFSTALTEEGFDSFLESMTTACEGTGSDTGKLFVQVYCADPSEVAVGEDQAVWLGIQYDFSSEDSSVTLQGASLFVPTDGVDPMLDPDFKGCTHVTISNTAIDWEKF